MMNFSSFSFIWEHYLHPQMIFSWVQSSVIDSSFLSTFKKYFTYFWPPWFLMRCFQSPQTTSYSSSKRGSGLISHPNHADFTGPSLRHNTSPSRLPLCDVITHITLTVVIPSHAGLAHLFLLISTSWGVEEEGAEGGKRKEGGKRRERGRWRGRRRRLKRRRRGWRGRRRRNKRRGGEGGN